MNIRSETLNSRLDLSPPSQVFHYTSPSGLIGILRSKKIWATNIRYLNDFSELVEASNFARNILEEMLDSGKYKDEAGLLEKMREKVGTAASRYYVCSFSEDQDSLSQWRAYCPPTGGYALGIPTGQLSKLAKQCDWFFIKCVYKEDLKDRIIREIIMSFIGDFKNGISDNEYKKDHDDLDDFKEKIALNFHIYIAKIGGAIKNEAFESECEWRLISPSIVETNENIEFREGASSIIPYYKFNLKTKENPNLTKFGKDRIKLIVGPTPQMNSEAQQAAQYILRRYLGISKGHSLSRIPYKGW